MWNFEGIIFYKQEHREIFKSAIVTFKTFLFDKFGCVSWNKDRSA